MQAPGRKPLAGVDTLADSVDLLLYTGATDLTDAAIATAASVSVLATLPELVLRDNEALTIKFLSAASTYESWTIAGGYTVSAVLGTGTTDGTQNYAAAGGFTDIANGFSGRIDLDQDDLAGAIVAQRNRRPNQPGGWFTLQIAVTDSSSRTQTYATLPIFVRTSVR